MEDAWDKVDLWNPEYQHGMDELSKEIGFNLEQGCDGFCAYIRNENPKYCDICSAGICFKQVNELVADINQYHNAELALATSSWILMAHPLEDLIVYLTIQFHLQCIRLLNSLK